MREIFSLFWFISLVLSIILSFFLHELGHGISALYQGIPISTGFNKVGDIYKKPSDKDFRVNNYDKQTIWDFGPILTLLLAIIFTIFIYIFDNKSLLIIIGTFAFTNSLLRFIPMLISYFSLITKGELKMEDEIGMGKIWYERTGISILKFVPSLISIVISGVCFYYTIEGLNLKLPLLFIYNWNFTLISIGSLIITTPIIKFLDEKVRINWG